MSRTHTMHPLPNPLPKGDGTGADPAAAMDRMYRYTRHAYDLSRRWYLLGRDRMLRGLDVPPGGTVLEIGCGTARNLITLAGLTATLTPPPRLYGVDASQQMLDTAAGKLAGAGLAGRVQLQQGLAERLHPCDLGVEAFDRVYFSYCLSMVPPWREAVDAALAALRPDGSLHVVDFYDQADLPAWFRRTLVRWLAMFHVHYRAELLPYLEAAAARHGATCRVEPVARRYAFIAVLQLPGG